MKRLCAQMLGLALAVLIATTVTPPAPVEPERLSAAEFSRLIRDFSEEGGYFMSDNFTSSEDSYLTIVNKLQDLAIHDGAYIGVGPERFKREAGKLSRQHSGL